MKTKIIIYLTMLISLIFTAKADLITWSRTYNGEFHHEDVAIDVEQTMDGGYIIAGNEWVEAYLSPDWIFPHMRVIKFNENGDTLWASKYYYNIQNSTMFDDYWNKYAEVYDIEQTSDGGYVMCGYTEVEYPDSTPNYRETMCIVKLDQYGEIEWDKIYLEGFYNKATSIEQTSDGGYIVAGTFIKLGEYTEQVGRLLRINSNGDTLWSKNYSRDDTLNTYFNDLHIDQEGNYIVTGSNTIKFDQSSNVIWSYKHDKDEMINEIIETQNGSFMLTGRRYLDSMNTLGNFCSGILLKELSSQGDSLWAKLIHSGVYKEPDYGRSIQQTIDGGFIIGAETDQFNYRDWWIIKTDSSGDTLWTKIYGVGTSIVLNSIKHTSDGGYIVCGDTKGNYLTGSPHDWRDMWILKLDQYGNYTGIMDNGEWEIDNFELAQNYPNPFNNQTSIGYILQNTCEVELTVFNSKGEFVQNLVKTRQSKGKQLVIFNANNLNSGIYYCQLKIDGITKETKKMLYLK